MTRYSLHQNIKAFPQIIAYTPKDKDCIANCHDRINYWIVPEIQGLNPSYEEKNFSNQIQAEQLVLLGSRDGRNNSVTIHQDVNLYLGSLKQNDSLTYQITDKRGIWLQVAKGEIKLNEHQLQAGDGAAITDETEIVIAGNSYDGEVLLFDLAINN